MYEQMANRQDQTNRELQPRGLRFHGMEDQLQVGRVMPPGTVQSPHKTGWIDVCQYGNTAIMNN